MIYEDQYVTAWGVAFGAYAVALLLFYRYIRWIKLAEVRFFLLFAVSILALYPQRIMEPVEFIAPAFIVFGFSFVDSKFDVAATLPMLATPLALIAILGVVLALVMVARLVFLSPKQQESEKERKEPQ